MSVETCPQRAQHHLMESCGSCPYAESRPATGNATEPPYLRCCGAPLAPDGRCQHRPAHRQAPEAALLALLRRALDDIDAAQGVVTASTWGTLLAVADALAEQIVRLDAATPVTIPMNPDLLDHDMQRPPRNPGVPTRRRRGRDVELDRPERFS